MVPVMGSDSAFGATLRRLRSRADLSLRALASLCGIDHTHLSRLERGRVPSRDLLERLGEALGPEALVELAAAAGRLPARVEETLASFPHAMTPAVLEKWTVPSLRRSEASHRAEPLLLRAPAGGVSRGRIDPEALCRYQGFQPRFETGAGFGPVVVFGDRTVTIRDPGDRDDAGSLPRQRFLVAHAAAHLIAEQQACTFPRMTGEEQLACDVAAYLLCPRGLLEQAVLAARIELGEDVSGPWASRSGDIVSAVAEKLAIPGWVAVRRLADDALLEDDAIYYSFGDQP